MYYRGRRSVHSVSNISVKNFDILQQKVCFYIITNYIWFYCYFQINAITFVDKTTRPFTQDMKNMGYISVSK